MKNNNPELYEIVAPLEKNFPVKFSVTEGQSPLHWHEYIEFLYCPSGNGKCYCGNQVYNIKEKEMITANPGELHASDLGKLYCLRIHPSFFADVSFEDVLIRRHITEDEMVCAYMESVFAEYNEKKLGYDMAVKGIVYSFMSYLLRNHKVRELPTSNDNNLQDKTSRVGQILLYITQNFHDKITTRELANRFHLNENYFCSLFKSQTHMSPMAYIHAFRIEKAGILLRNTESSIAEIAESVGFDDFSYFAKVFKQHTGVTPRENRKAMR